MDVDVVGSIGVGVLEAAAGDEGDAGAVGADGRVGAAQVWAVEILLMRMVAPVLRSQRMTSGRPLMSPGPGWSVSKAT